MSARVNLLPREVAERRRGRRALLVSGLVLLLFVTLLAAVYVAKLGDVADARRERDAVQLEVTERQAVVAELQQFQQLANELDTREELLTIAMAREVSVARTLNDLALSLPPTSSLRAAALTVDVDAVPPAEAPPVTPGTDLDSDTEDIDGIDEVVDEEDATIEPVIGNLTYEGYSIERYAPGVAAVVLQLDDVMGFVAPYVSTAQLEEIDTTEVTGFTGDVSLTADAFTRRYLDGLPEEETP